MMNSTQSIQMSLGIPIYMETWRNRRDETWKPREKSTINAKDFERFEIPAKKQEIKLVRIDVDEKIINLNGSIRVELFLEDGFWFANNDELSIYSSGRSRVDAIKEFSEVLFDFHSMYIEDDPCNLSDDSKIIREKMIRLFGDNEL